MINLRVQAPEMKQNVLAPRITVVGVGGAGGNAINNMITTGLDGVEFVVCNTDAQSLAGGRAGKKIQLGANITGGLGAGAKPDVGRAAAEESLDDVMAHIEGSNMVFITSGMGGGTGTGAAPVIARACREAGILTVGVVTKPFHFEGPVRMKAAEEGIREMQQYVDTLIVIPNQNLFRIANEKTTFGDAFKLADSVLQSAVRGVTDLMIMPGLVNLDFNDIKTTMTEMGKAMMGTGEASGDRRAVLASEAAISNPLLDDVTLKGAKGVIINIAGGNDMTLYEIDEACNRIRTEVDADANIIFGTSIDESLQGSLRVTVLATGIEAEADRKARDDTRSRRMMGQQPVSNMRTGETREAAAASAATARPYAAAVSIEETTFTAPISAPAAELPTTMPYIQGQAFIPPAPVEAEVGTASAATVSYNRILSGVPGPKMGEELAPLTLSAPEVAVSMSAVPAPAPAEVPTDLAIPASMVPAAPARRAPSATQEPALSLFQRITNRVRRTVEVAFEDSSASEPAYQAQYVASTRGTSAVSAQPLPAAAREPVDIARPAKAPSPQAELDLDIPAFLRRQAS